MRAVQLADTRLSSLDLQFIIHARSEVVYHHHLRLGPQSVLLALQTITSMAGKQLSQSYFHKTVRRVFKLIFIATNAIVGSFSMPTRTRVSMEAEPVILPMAGTEPRTDSSSSAETETEINEYLLSIYPVRLLKSKQSYC